MFATGCAGRRPAGRAVTPRAGGSTVAEVVVVGAGIGALATALLLGREGRDVVVCERDPAPVPAAADDMWSEWARPGVPQARLGHCFLSGFRVLLEARAPDVLERLYATGAPLVDFAADMPGDERRPDDRAMTAIMCRRPILEGILRQAVQAEPTVDVRCGCDVVGLVAEPSLRGVPKVVGVRTRDHGSIAAATVVIAGGRRVPMQRWFAQIGAARPVEQSEACGFVCYTRFFRVRLRPGEDHHVSTALAVEGDLGYMKYEIFGADRSTFCVELIPPARDRELRGLRHESAWMAAVRALPEALDWLDPERATPIGPVAAMGEERNLLREFVSAGRPIALGLHVIGDARCQTNSLYAWGSGSALAAAATLVDVLTEYPGDPEAQALAFEAERGAEITGRFELSRARDRAFRRLQDAEPEWDDTDRGHGLLHGVVVPAADEDPDVYRAVTRWELQLDHVDALAANTGVLDRARALAAVRESQPEPTPTPTRETLLEITAAATAAT
jgi:2-polyprenyl-6-methoxyphenol hydroxylase-like FAD-dependent oxidoreductase